MKVEELEKLASKIGLLIKIQVRETLGLCFFRIVIAEQKDNIIKIWAEMKGWTYLNKQGKCTNGQKHVQKSQLIFT